MSIDAADDSAVSMHSRIANMCNARRRRGMQQKRKKRQGHGQGQGQEQGQGQGQGRGKGRGQGRGQGQGDGVAGEADLRREERWEEEEGWEGPVERFGSRCRTCSAASAPRVPHTLQSNARIKTRPE
eukprot:3677126-Rhodomonas_salina.1